MRQYLQELKDFIHKGDLVLLFLCLVTTAFGALVIASATNYIGSSRYVVIHILASAIGVFLYVLISAVDLEFLAEHRLTLVFFNLGLLFLLIPFGTDNNTGNRSWLDFPFLPVDVQPAEICKITYVLIMASVMSSHQNRISSIPSVFHMVYHLALLVGMNLLMSRDLGVSLIFVFIFIGMTFAGGVKWYWFALAIGAIVVVAPFAWEYLLEDYQKARLEVLWNPDLDPMGLDERYHMVRSLASLTGGGLTGQGLFNGNRTQNGELFAQHTDYIFSTIGEELGFLGCGLVLVLLFLVIARCIQVGISSQDYMRRMVCFGAAASMIFQVVSNVGMCIGLTPVIGLTLPFISYGGSSILTLYAMLGLVSGVHARPTSSSHERYVRPYR